MRRWFGAVLVMAFAVSLALPARAQNMRWKRLRHGGRDPYSWRGPDQYDPFEEFERIQRMMDRLFEESLRGDYRRHVVTGFEPSLDIQETGKNIIVKCDLPGMDKDKIDISLRDNVLTISGERERIEEVRDELSSYYRSERSFGSFSRSVTLPAEVDEGSIKAEYKDGVLTVILQKLETTKPGGVKIRVL